MTIGATAGPADLHLQRRPARTRAVRAAHMSWLRACSGWPTIARVAG